MKAATLVLSLLFLFSFLPVSPAEAAPSADAVVICEVATASWCQGCPNTGAALEQLRSSDDNFYYVMMVTDKNDRAAERIDDYNPAVYPTSFFDGGYDLVVGGKSATEPYRSAVQSCHSRERADVALSVDVQWQDGELVVGVRIQSGEVYEGTVRASIVEPHSRWKDYDGEAYRYAFLDVAVEQSVTVDGSLYLDAGWNASQAGFSGVTRDNVMVIAGLFNAEGHTRYSDPPDNTKQFTAHYVDAAAAARPPADAPPEVSITEKPAQTIGVRNASFAWTATDDITPSGEITFSSRLLGHSEAWSSWTDVQERSYDGLPDGTYTFEVRARDSAGQIATARWQFAVDTSSPVVIATRPVDDATGIDAFTTIRVTFSHPMDQTDAAQAVTLTPAVAYSASWRDATHLIIAPQDQWAYETTYTVTLSTQLQRTSGQYLARPFSFSFQVASADTTPPTVVETHPSRGGSLPANGTIRIQFSEEMETRYFIRALELQPWFPHYLQWDGNGSLLTIVSNLLQPGTYTVTVNRHAVDRHRNHLPAPYAFSFTVTRPTLLSTWPADGARKVPVDTSVTLRFSEAMDRASVVAALTAHFSYVTTWNGTSITLRPTSNLSHSTSYTVRLHENATNLYGISLDASHAITFTTTEPPRPGRGSDDGQDVPAFTGELMLAAVAVVLLWWHRPR